jgi:hypothetical protein
MNILQQIENTNTSFENGNKIPLLEELSQFFPLTAAEKFQMAEAICTVNPEFNRIGESEKADFVINEIINNREIFNESTATMLRAHSYIKNLNPDSIAISYFDDSGLIAEHPFFSKEKASFSEETLLHLYNQLQEINENFEPKYAEINVHLNLLINYIKNTVLWPNNEEIKILKQKLDKALKEVNKRQEDISALSCYNILKLKELENEICIINSGNQKQSLSGQLDAFITEINACIKKQEEIIHAVSTLQLLPIDQILKFPAYINKFSLLLLNYYNLKNIIRTAEANNLEQKKLNQLNQAEAMMAERFKNFIDLSRKTFSRYLEGVKDKKSIAKSRFLEPVKNRMDIKSFNLMSYFIDLLYI